MVLHPKVGGDRTFQVKQGGSCRHGEEEGTAQQDHQGEDGCQRLRPRAARAEWARAG